MVYIAAGEGMGTLKNDPVYMVCKIMNKAIKVMAERRELEF